MSWKPRALVVVAALWCAARPGANASSPVPTISVVEPPATEVPAVALPLPATLPPAESVQAPHFVVSTAAAEDRSGITVPVISPAPPASVAAVQPDRIDAPPAHTSAAAAEFDRATAREEPAVFFSVPCYAATLLEREIVAACLVLEAASQGEFGMRAVMAVIRNRAHGLPELFVPTVLEARQFSAFNRVTAGLESLAAAVSRARHDRMWAPALWIVDRAMDDSWADPTDGATHYTRSGERTRWTRRLAKTTTIGAHSFYR